MTKSQRPLTQESEELHQPCVGKHIIFYDGVCGLCNKFIQFVIENDTNGLFYFAALQSDFAGNTLRRRGADPTKLDTVYVVANYGTPKEKTLKMSDAAVFAISQLKPWVRPFATILGIIPKPLRDLGYSTVAKIRYKLFGKYDSCMLPTPETRTRFIDQ